MHALPKNWLVFRLSALGDVVLTTGVLRRWHEAYGWRFRVLTKEAFAPVFAEHPAVDAVIPATGADLAMPRMGRWFAQLARQHAGWGLLDLHATVRSAFLAALWRGPVRRYAKYGPARRLFLLSGGRWRRDLLGKANVPQRYALAVEETPPARESVRPCLWLTESERTWGKTFLANLFPDDIVKNGSGPAGPVALHPFAAHACKAWPQEQYRELAALLDARAIPWLALGRGTPLFPGDARDLTDTTTVRQSAALLAACSALVSGDSGPMHLATAVGTPVIGLFGPTTREWGFFPSGERDRVLERQLPCRPCSLHGKKACPREGECLARITPEMALAALEGVWRGDVSA